MINRLLLFLFLMSLAPLSAESYRPPRARTVREDRQQRKKIDLEEEMTPQQFRRSGLQKLSSQEKRNLEVWLSKWREDEVRSETTNILAITNIEQSGRVIRLSDGSAWKVAPFSIRISRNWSRDHRIEIQASNRLGKYYKLFNRSTREEAEAEQLAGASIDGEANSYSISRIGRGGDTITLSDGSVWKVSLINRRFTRDWTPGHTIEIQGLVSRGQTTQLYNTDTRSGADATLLYGPRPPETTPEEEEEQKINEEAPGDKEDDQSKDIYQNWRQRRNEPLHRDENPEEQPPHGSTRTN